MYKCSTYRHTNICFNFPAGYNVRFLQRTKASPLELARKRFPRPNKNELSEALTNSLSFLIVREPFERLLSAYRNKLEGYRNKYYKILGEQIVKKYRKGGKKVSKQIVFLTMSSLPICLSLIHQLSILVFVWTNIYRIFNISHT